jgi:hypothetical protein
MFYRDACLLIVGVVCACRGKNKPDPSLDTSTPDVVSSVSSAQAPVGEPTGTAPASHEDDIVLDDHDRSLHLEWGGGMLRRCERTKALEAPPSGRYDVDLSTGDITFQIRSACDGNITRRGSLPKSARARLKALVGEHAVRAPDGPAYTLTLVHADGGVASQADAAPELADFIRGFLGK